MGEPRVAVEGEIVEQYNGEPLENIEVALVRTGGVQIGQDSIVTQTDARGRFSFAVPASESGKLQADFLVTRPGWSPYRIQGEQIATSEVRGHGTILPRWVTPTYFPYAGEIFDRRTGRRVSGARVQFRRTGGAQLIGASWNDSRYVAVTDAGGRFPLLEFVYPREAGEVVGDVTISVPGSSRNYTIRGVTLRSTHIANAPVQIVVMGIGSVFNRVGELVYRGSGERVAGAQVQFRRTGGVPVEPDTFVVRTDVAGRFPIMPLPRAEGEVTFDLHVRPPAPYQPEIIRNVRMSTTESDHAQLLGVWAVGAYLGYVGELVYLDPYRPAVGVEVEFRRTGGIPVEPDTFVVRTDAGGRFPLMPRPLRLEGEVQFELHVRPPSGRSSVIRGLRMEPHRDDQTRLLGVWAAEAP